MTLAVTLPADLVYDLDMRVNAGEFASRDAAAAYFIRRGLGGPASGPHSPPGFPPRRVPGDDDVPRTGDPTDVNWARD